MTLQTKLEAARKQAIEGGIPVRRKDRDLYATLAACLEICEEVVRDGLEPQLRSIIQVSVAGQGLSVDEARVGKRFTYKASDAYLLVCRYVLSDTETKQLQSKYSQALREAARRQISSAQLPEWLKKNGGVLALYNSRPTAGKRNGGIRVLNLMTPVDPRRDGKAFTLTLRNRGGGFFEVIGEKDESHN